MSSLFGRRFTTSGSVIAGLTTVLALWFGLSAPSVSPVAPTPVAVQAPATTTNPGTTDIPVSFDQHHQHR
jgi:hypothetical protein